jgi:hypothetical protein
MCKNHKDIHSGYFIFNKDGTKIWEDALQEIGLQWTISFMASPNDKSQICSFDCETVFAAFTKSSDCNFTLRGVER